jgi:hypothetical protein
MIMVIPPVIVVFTFHSTSVYPEPVVPATEREGRTGRGLIPLEHRVREGRRPIGLGGTNRRRHLPSFKPQHGEGISGDGNLERL